MSITVELGNRVGAAGYFVSQSERGTGTSPVTGNQGSGRGGTRIGLGLEDRGGGGNEPPLRPTDSEENPEARKRAMEFALFWTNSDMGVDLKSFGFRQKPRGTTIFDIIQLGTPPLAYSDRQKGLDSNLAQHTHLTDPAKEFLSLVRNVSSALFIAPEKIISLKQLRLEGTDIGIFTSDRTLLSSIEGDLLDNLINSLLDENRPSDLVRLAGKEQIQNLVSRWSNAIKAEYGSAK